MLFRVNEGSLIYSGFFSNAAVNATYNYIASSYENLNSIIKDGPHNMPLANTFILLYKLLGVYDEETMLSSALYQTNNMYNASPIIGCYYFDLGIAGVFLGLSFIAVFLNSIYLRSKKNIYCLLILSMFQKGVMVVCLGDAFINHGSFSALLGYMVVISICVLSQLTHAVKISSYHQIRSVLHERSSYF